MSHEPARYVGRFAPSPTGPLHFGSLLAAAASYLQARANNGAWLLRIEDIDPPREPAGADKLILDALEAYGFEWDGDVTYQSTFTPRHETVFQDLLARGCAYPCDCSRKTLAEAPRGVLGTIYPGTCRAGCDGKDVAYRLVTNNEPISFTDVLQGTLTQRLESESGDFVIKRRDGLIAYHLAVVIDDFDQGITEVVRGIDLLDTTPRHIYLQRCLGFTTPAYLHIPVAVNAAGQKLSKLTGACAVSTRHIRETLLQILHALGQDPPADASGAAVTEIWSWAISHWNYRPLQNVKSIPADQYATADAENGLS